MESKILASIFLILLSFSATGYLYFERVKMTSTYEADTEQLHSLLTMKNITVSNMNATILEKESIISVQSEEIETLYNDVEMIDQEIVMRVQEITELNHNITIMIYQKNNLILENDRLTTQNENLLNTISTKNNELHDLTSDYWSLNAQYENVKEYADSTEERRRMLIGHNLTSYYDVVRYRYGLAGDKNSYDDLEKLKFAEKLILHDLGRPQFMEIELDYLSSIIRSQDEGTGHTVGSETLAKRFIDIAVSCCDIYENDTATLKISKILELINNCLVHHPETDDLYRSPVEVLSIGSGDCDDYSILAAAFFEYVGIDTALGIYENSEHEWHMMTLVRLDSIDEEYWYWDDLTHFGLQPGRWIDIEPQRLITEQGENEWFDQWELMEAIEISY